MNKQEKFIKDLYKSIGIKDPDAFIEASKNDWSHSHTDQMIPKQKSITTTTPQVDKKQNINWWERNESIIAFILIVLGLLLFYWFIDILGKNAPQQNLSTEKEMELWLECKKQSIADRGTTECGPSPDSREN